MPDPTTFHPDLRVELDGVIGRLVLDRPDQLNPLSAELLLAIEAACRWFDLQDGLKVVVLSGEGRAFCAGADVAAMAGAADDGMSVRSRADAGRRAADALEAMSAVTVARLHGHCIGGGVVLAAATDLRVAAADTNFCIPEVDLGIPLAWGGLPRLIREIGGAGDTGPGDDLPELRCDRGRSTRAGPTCRGR